MKFFLYGIVGPLGVACVAQLFLPIEIVVSLVGMYMLGGAFRWMIMYLNGDF